MRARRELLALVLDQPPQRPANVLANGRPPRPRTDFNAACRGNRSKAARSSPSAAAPPGAARARARRPPQGRPRRGPRPRRPRRSESRAGYCLGADEDVQPVRSDRARRGRTGHRRPSGRPGSPRAPAARRPGTGTRSRSPGELVEVERQRRTCRRRGDEVLEQLASVERSTAVRSRRPRLRQPARRGPRALGVGRGLRAAVRHDPQASGGGGRTARGRAGVPHARAGFPRRSCRAPGARPARPPRRSPRRHKRGLVERRPPSRSGVTIAASAPRSFDIRKRCA